MLTNFAGILFDGIAYGSLLFLIGIGLSVTMGLMNFINLAHGAFAMLGGYICVAAMTRLGCLSSLHFRLRSSSPRSQASSSSAPSISGYTRPAISIRCCSASG